MAAVMPTRVGGKVRDAGDAESAGTGAPVPVMAMVRGDLGSLLGMRKLAVRVPVAAGVKVTV